MYAYVQLDGSWGINNTGFIVGRRRRDRDRHVLHRAPHARVPRAPSRRVARSRSATLVNTHHHGDHTHGNYLGPPATIVGHDRCRDEVIASGISTAMALFRGADWGELEVAPPFVTFDDHLDVWVDDTRSSCTTSAPAHTTNDIVAWLPERRILFAGDLVFNGGTPFVVMGSVAGSLDAVERLRALRRRT